MKIYDITVPISENMPVYDGDPAVRIGVAASIKGGDAANVTELSLSAHCGTHVDAPNHFIDGTKRIHELEIEKLIGLCRVVELDESVTAITPEHLQQIDGAERVLFKTRNSRFWGEAGQTFRTDFTYITPEAAKCLAEKDLLLVGIDYISVDRADSEDFAAHRILLEKEIVVLEGVDLRGVPAGDYEIICLPLKIIGPMGDGAPARALLREIR